LYTNVYSQFTSDNLKRASSFLTKKTFDVILSCKDTKNYCPIQKDGKSVGGYAWTYDGWFGYKYYYITMCQPFFRTDDLMGKIDLIEKEMAQGNPQKAQEAVWQKSTGQMFLHEMMHLNSVGDPHSKYDLYLSRWYLEQCETKTAQHVKNIQANLFLLTQTHKLLVTNNCFSRRRTRGSK
jgi:hypothetical protein